MRKLCLIILIVEVMFHIWLAIVARQPLVPAAGRLAAPFLELLPLKAAAEGSTLFLSTHSGCAEIPLAWGICVPASIWLMFSYGMIIVLRKGGWKDFAKWSVVTIFVVLGTVIGIAVVQVSGIYDGVLHSNFPRYWGWILAGISWCGFAATRGNEQHEGFQGLGETDQDEKIGGLMERYLMWYGGAIVLAWAVWSWPYYYPTNGSAERPPQVIVDDAHSKWSPAGGSLSPEDRQRLSLYNYRAFVHLLRTHYRVKILREGAIDRTLLEECDLLLLKIPTRAYSLQEIDTICRYVQEGGGLMLMGDHTNVFGSSSYLNPIAERFGIHYVPDAVSGSREGAAWVTSTCFRHPLAAPKALPLLTPCSIELPFRRNCVYGSPNTHRHLASYGHRTFWPSTHDPLGRCIVAPSLVCAAMRIGKGRVVAISDTTFLSSFCLYYPGTPEWIMRVVGWAAGEPIRSGWTFFAPILGCLVGAFLLGCDGRVIGYCGLGVSLMSMGTWGYLQEVQAKQADTIPRDVCFLHAWSRMSVKSILMIEGGAQDPSDYGTLYAVSVQLSLKPGLHGPLPDPQAGRAVVVNPHQVPKQRILEALQAWIRRGGWLYLCVGPDEKSRRIVGRWGECLGGNPPSNRPPPFLDEKALSSLGEIRWIRQGEGMIVGIMEGGRVTTESLESIGTEEISDEAFRRRQGWFELLKGPDEQEKS